MYKFFKMAITKPYFNLKDFCWFYLVVHNKFNTQYFILVLCTSWTKLIQQMILNFNSMHYRWNQTQSYLDALKCFWEFKALFQIFFQKFYTKGSMKPKKLKTEAKASIPNLDLDMNIS